MSSGQADERFLKTAGGTLVDGLLVDGRWDGEKAVRRRGWKPDKSRNLEFHEIGQKL